MSRFLAGLIAVIFAFTGYAAEKAPDFTLSNMEGKKVQLSEVLKKGPVLLDFWATWCKPCLQELPHLDKLHREYSTKGLQTLTISIDNPKSQAKVKPLVKSAGYTFEVLLDGDMQVRKSLGGQDIPLTLLIDRNREVVYRHLGYVAGDEKKLEEAVKKLLAVPDSTKAAVQ